MRLFGALFWCLDSLSTLVLITSNAVSGTSFYIRGNIIMWNKAEGNNCLNDDLGLAIFKEGSCIYNK